MGTQMTQMQRSSPQIQKRMYLSAKGPQAVSSELFLCLRCTSLKADTGVGHYALAFVGSIAF